MKPLSLPDQISKGPDLSRRMLGWVRAAWSHMFPVPDDISAELRSLQRRAIIENTPMTVVIVMSATVLLGIAFWGQVAPALIALWCLVNCAMGTCAIMHVFRSTRIERIDLSAGGFQRRVVLWYLFAGILWGSIPFVFFLPGLPELQIFLGVVLALLSIGTVTAMAVLPIAVIAYAVPAIVPLTVQLALLGTRYSSTMAALCILCFGALFVFLRTNYRGQCEVIRSRARALTAEQILHAGTEAVGDGFVVYDRHRRVVHHNQRFLEFNAHLKAFPSLLGRSFAELAEAGLQAGFTTTTSLSWQIRKHGLPSANEQ